MLAECLKVKCSFLSLNNTPQSVGSEGVSQQVFVKVFSFLIGYLPVFTLNITMLYTHLYNCINNSKQRDVLKSGLIVLFNLKRI